MGRHFLFIQKKNARNFYLPSVYFNKTSIIMNIHQELLLLHSDNLKDLDRVFYKILNSMFVDFNWILLEWLKMLLSPLCFTSTNLG